MFKMNSINSFVKSHFPGASNYQSEKNNSDDMSQSKLSEKSSLPEGLKLAKYFQKNAGTEI